MFDIIDGNIKLFFTSIRMTDAEVPMHLQANFEILVVTEGELHIFINEKEYTVKAGNAIFVPPFASHSLSNKKSYSICALMFTKEIIPEFYELLKSNTATKIIFPLSDVSLAVLDRFIPDTKYSDEPFIARAVLGPIICELYEKCEFSYDKIPLSNIFYSALEYMMDHSTENLTRESVAKALGVHPITLSKCFSKHKYMNFNNALNQIRCNHAAILIQQGDISLTEIAFSSGFGSIRSFNRAFMNVYKVTPSEFKKEYSKKKISL